VPLRIRPAALDDQAIDRTKAQHASVRTAESAASEFWDLIGLPPEFRRGEEMLAATRSRSE